MREHEFHFDIEATRDEVWRALHPRPHPTADGSHRVIEYGGVCIEIVHEGDEHGAGLVRTCTFPVPRILLSGGVGRSWECVTESRPPGFARYESVGKPLWSKASGWHRLDDLGNGMTRVAFGETYHAFNPILRVLLERYVHDFISRDNDTTIRAAVESGVTRQRARRERPGDGATP